MSEVIFEEIEFKNFMSFGNIPTTVRLDDPGTTLIMGENLDAGGSSGAGKTTLINVLSYAAYDKIMSGVSKDRLINQTNDKKNTSMEAKFTFRTNGHVYKIHRRRGAIGGLQLFEDGHDITPASSGAFNAKIEELLGFSYNMFSQVILFNGNAKPFLDLSVGDQRTLIEELFKITTLSKKANACKKWVNQTDKDIGLQKLLIQQQQKQNDTYQKRLREARDRVSQWETRQAATIVKVTEDLQFIGAFDFDSEEALLNEITSLQTSLLPLQSQVREVNTQLTSKKNERFSKKTELALLESGLVKKQTDLKKKTGELGHLADLKCPYCLQKYDDAKTKIFTLDAEKLQLEEEIVNDGEAIELLKVAEADFNSAQQLAVEALSTEIKAIQQQIVDLTNSLNEIKGAVTYSSIKELTRARDSIAALQTRIESLRAEPNPYVEAVATLEAEGEIEVGHDKLEELLTLQEHQQFLVKLLMDKNSFIRKNLISKTIPFLNKRIGYYTECLSLPHLIMFQPDMSCEISEYGRPLDHGNLSNGEKKRLNLSLCLAFRDVLTFLHSKVNVLFTDEIDGGSLDSHCVDSLIGLLKRKAWDDELGIYIISHRPEFDGRCDRNLIIRKERGFSTIITQPDE